MKKKSIYRLENGIYIEAKSTRDIRKFVGDLLFFNDKFPLEPVFHTKIGDIFIHSKPQIKKNKKSK